MSTPIRAFRPFVGARVIRGPDWKHGNQDGGEGHLGTLRKYKSSEEVIVVWDNGKADTYRYGSAHDLRILDSAPAGIKHDSVTCDECGERPLHGIRWKCKECNNYDLCSMCYHGDEHNLQHEFYRIDLYRDKRALVGPRENEYKIPAFGLFEGARVTRGGDWEYGAQDGNFFWKFGEIKEITEWKNSIPRSGARVAWDLGKNFVCRVGFEGKVDIKTSKGAEGYSFYLDHLPILDTVFVSTGLAPGDKVRIELDEEAVQLLQIGHGGWTDSMKESLSNTGKIVGFDRDNDALVVYPSGRRWIFNPDALMRDDRDTADGSSFEVGDNVCISSDSKRVKALQRGHGDWVDAMSPTLGSIGEVKSVLPTGDLKIKVAGMTWVYNPECVSKADTTVDDTAGYSYDALPKLFESGTSEDPTEVMIEAAVTNNVEKIQMVLSDGNVQINDTLYGLSAIQVASYYGSVEVVEFLIQNGVDLESQDKSGDRAIHTAAHRDEAKILELLAQAGADINSKNNKSQSALHIAVNECNTRTVRCLLELKANPSLQDSIGETPLHEAITKNEDGIVQLLLEFEADISVTDTKGFSCLHHAALKGNESAVTAILATGPHPRIINEKKEDGFTALHLASLNNHQKVAEILIKQGKADIDSQNDALQTPLHLAVVGNSLQIVKLLVEEGADLDIKDKVGDTPMHEAIRHHTFLKLTEMQDSSTSIAMALLGLKNPKRDLESSFSIACFLATHGADLTLENFTSQTPLDLCHDPKLSDAISKCHVVRSSTKVSVESGSAGTVRTNGSVGTMNTTESPRAEGTIDSPLTVKATGSLDAPRTTENTTARKSPGFTVDDQEPGTGCIICCDMPRDTMHIPCLHRAVCSLCSPRVKKCLICKGSVESTSQIECLVCSDKKPDVLFKPCNHSCVCSRCAKLMKRCAQCRKLIEHTVAYDDASGDDSTSEPAALDDQRQALIDESDVESFASLTDDMHKLEQTFMRYERKVVSTPGATLELHNTGIKLQVPEGAFEVDAIVQLDILDPSTIPQIPTDLGEAVLSHIIKVGPDEVKFKVPAILSIPHSVTQIPKHSSICINHFYSDSQKWEKIPCFSDLDELNTNCGYITKSGLYALCLLLDTECHVIPSTSTKIRLFNEDNSVAITFDEDTFDAEETRVEFKINTLSERMFKEFTSAGIKPSIILHINAASNDQPKKPVAIQMPIPSGLNKCGEIIIFKSDHDDDFTNATEYIPFEVSEHHALLRVDHFSKYWIVGALKEILDIAPLVNFFNPVYDVCFWVYIKQESTIRIGCCESHKEEEMNNKMKMHCNYATVDFINGNLRNGDASIVAIHGRNRISEPESSLQLIFKAKEITYTQQLYLEASQPSEELASNMKNEVEVSIGMKGMREPVLIKFMIAHGIKIHAHLQASMTQNRKRLTRKDKSGEFGATEQPLLSELKEDYNLVQYLEQELESATMNDIKALLRVFGLSYQDGCKVLNCASPSLAFFENLSKSRPGLKLVEVKAIIEEKYFNLQPNKAIFMTVEEDIANDKVSFSLDTTLKDLSDHPENWYYILDTVACNLIQEEGYLLKSWKNLACGVGFTAANINTFQRMNTEESPFRKLLSILCRNDLSLCVSFFVGKLREIKRKDLAKVVEDWLADIVNKRAHLEDT